MGSEHDCVSRGGGWSNRTFNVRVTFRSWLAPGNRYSSLGVRLFRMVSPVQQLAEVNNGR